jgi:hypothetical protein
MEERKKKRRIGIPRPGGDCVDPGNNPNGQTKLR